MRTLLQRSLTSRQKATDGVYQENMRGCVRARARLYVRLDVEADDGQFGLFV